MAESVNEVGDDLSTKARQATPAYSMLQCSWCDEEAYPPDSAQVARLVEHAVHGHGSHVPIIGVRYDEFISGYELALRLGTPALTDAEQVWRMAGCSHPSSTEIASLANGSRVWQCDTCEFKWGELRG